MEGAWGGSSFTGDPGRYVEKVFGYGYLRGDPFSVKRNLVRGGSCITGILIDERRSVVVVGHRSVTDSIRRTLGEGSFTGEPER